MGFLTDKRIGELVRLSGELRKHYESDKAEFTVSGEKGYDALNRDLLASELNALLSLLGIMNIRIGLNISARGGEGQQIPESDAEGEKETAAEN